MKNILACLERQTFKDFEVIFVVDRNLKEIGEFTSKDHRVSFITNLTSSFHSKRDVNDPMIWGNASELRNYGIKAGQGDFMLLMDDDEQFDDDYLERNISLREKYRAVVGKDFVLVPTLMYRKTGSVQNYGFGYFNFWLGRPIPFILTKEWATIQMYSGNSLFAPAHIFLTTLFDEQLDFVYEDLDFTYRVHRDGHPLVILRDLRIYHMERDKTKLEEARVGNPYAAYRKSKHRMIFVRKYGSLSDKIKFYSFWFIWHPLWLTGYLLLKAPLKLAFPIITSLWRGLWDWLFCKI